MTPNSLDAEQPEVLAWIFRVPDPRPDMFQNPDSESMKFHAVHGSNVILSESNSKAEKLVDGSSILSGNRALQRGEMLVLTRLDNGSSVVEIGLTESDPSNLSKALPYCKCLVCGRDKSLRWPVKPHRGTKLAIFLEKFSNKVMIAKDGSNPEELIPGFETERPVYVVLDLFSKGMSIRMRSMTETQLGPILKSPVGLIIESETFRNLELRQANFAAAEESSIKLRRNLALSGDTPTSRGNFAFVDTSLKPNDILVLEVTALERSGRVRIVLTTKDTQRVYGSESLSELCDTTYSRTMSSEILESGDELAVRISTKGVVYLSHNNRGWIQRTRVDPDLEYHVVVDMKNITVLSMIGIATVVGEVDQNEIVIPNSLEPEPPLVVIQECTLCLDNVRSVVILPCFHVALCVACARVLNRQLGAKCPVCRVDIIKTGELLFP